MAKLIKVSHAVLPSEWAGYLVNGDTDNISEDDKKEVDAFLATLPKDTTCGGCGEEYFAWSFDVPTRYGCMVCEYVFLTNLRG